MHKVLIIRLHCVQLYGTTAEYYASLLENRVKLLW